MQSILVSVVISALGRLDEDALVDILEVVFGLLPGNVQDKAQRIVEILDRATDDDPDT